MVIERVPSVEMVRFVSSGTEACLSVLRLMRAFTKREKVLKVRKPARQHAEEWVPGYLAHGSRVTLNVLPCRQSKADKPGNVVFKS